MISAYLTTLQASFCALGGPGRLKRGIYPGTSKEHLKGMCSTRSVVVLSSPLDAGGFPQKLLLHPGPALHFHCLLKSSTPVIRTQQKLPILWRLVL